MDTHVSQQLLNAFGDKDVYHILGVERNADEPTITRAYRRLALRYHPDRRDGDNAKFQALSAAHSILANPRTRDIYDKTGDVDIEEESETERSWYEYFRALFPQMTVEGIAKFAAAYKGSEEETTDVLQAYLKYEGDLDNIMECIMCSEEGDEPRICDIIDGLIAANRAQIFKKYEKSKASALKKSLHNENAGNKKSKNKKKVKKGSTEEDDDSFAALALQIAESRRQREGAIGDIIAKYTTQSAVGKTTNNSSSATSKKRGGAVVTEGFHDSVSDEAFAAAQKKLMSNKKNKDAHA